MENLKVSQVAKMMGVSTQAVYKRLVTVGNLLATHLKKERGVTYLTPEGVRILQESFGDKLQEKVSSVGNLVATIESQVREQKEIIGNQQRTIESLIAQNEEQRKRTDTILMKLTSDISNLQKAIEYKQPVANMKNTREESRISSEFQTIRDDRRGVIHRESGNLKLPWYQRLWVEWFEPERLRRYAS